MGIRINDYSLVKVRVTGERRVGKCEDCGTQVENKFYMDGTRERIKPVCPKCGGEGRLIVRTYSVQPPPPPKCLSIPCLFRYFLDNLYCALLASYHRRRVQYAQEHKNDNILERYRTGEPSPKTIWQAVHANIKLKCPVCRKYNVDPLLGSNLYKEKRNGSN